MPQDTVIGRSPDTFTLPEAMALAGKWAAFEIYTPENLAVRLIQALGDTPQQCLAQLAESGADPRNFELVRLKAPFR